ncbi:hypothetical protein J6TS2_09660 [Heyndrickxia sporothermodurans]|nr:hypothetical protein J6TS2_09660 [Heyndrickxia sporothermodurans]
MRNESKKLPILISLGIIFILASLFFPFFLSSIIHDAVSKPRGAFGFTSDTSSYFLLTAAFVLIGLVFILLAIEAIRVKIRAIVTVILVIAAAIISVLGFDNYYYGTAEGFYFNPINSFGTREVLWKDISELEEIYQDVNGNQEAKKLVFKLKDGEKIEIDFYANLKLARLQIETLVKNNGGEVVTTIIEEKNK